MQYNTPYGTIQWHFCPIFAFIISYWQKLLPSGLWCRRTFDHWTINSFPEDREERNEVRLVQIPQTTTVTDLVHEIRNFVYFPLETEDFNQAGTELRIPHKLMCLGKLDTFSLPSHINVVKYSSHSKPHPTSFTFSFLVQTLTDIAISYRQ